MEHAAKHRRQPLDVTSVDACIVGGGPAGTVFALLLARQGVKVLLLEAHLDFDRDFRGDTIHPSTIEFLEQIGLLQQVMAIPHATIPDFPTHFPDGSVSPPGQERPFARHPRSLQLPQARLLALLVDEARGYPSFHLAMGARAEQLIEDRGLVTGIRYRASDGFHEVRSALIVGADGRFSRVRQLAGMQIENMSESMDVLWCRLPYGPSDPERAHGIYIGPDGPLVVMDRGDGWQVGYIFPKGAYQRLRAAGIVAFRESIARRAPWLGERSAHLRDWKQTSLLVIDAGRVRRWYQPGLLLIGDAAHVMSPVFGVGVNLAIQDAIVAANVLGRPLLRKSLRTSHLARVQHRRALPTSVMQLFQNRMRPPGAMEGQPIRQRLATALLDLPPVAKLRGRLIAYGGWQPERVRDLEEERTSPLERLLGALRVRDFVCTIGYSPVRR